MKALHILISPILILIAVGCQSHQTQMTSSMQAAAPQVTPAPAPPENATPAVAQQASTNSGPQQIITDDAIYTIEVIPNPRLSATSREGDQAKEVYSSNIIAVYRHPRNGATVNSTNSTATPSPGNNPQPPRQ